jgi:hypothetical protein
MIHYCHHSQQPGIYLHRCLPRLQPQLLFLQSAGLRGEHASRPSATQLKNWTCDRCLDLQQCWLPCCQCLLLQSNLCNFACPVCLTLLLLLLLLLLQLWHQFVPRLLGVSHHQAPPVALPWQDHVAACCEAIPMSLAVDALMTAVPGPAGAAMAADCVAEVAEVAATVAAAAAAVAARVIQLAASAACVALSHPTAWMCWC